MKDSLVEFQELVLLRPALLRVNRLLAGRVTLLATAVRSDAMDIAEACRTIRRANDFFVAQGTTTLEAKRLPEAVVVVKTYLENKRADGKCIQELLVADSSLLTHTGIQWVMPFVLSAESMEASKRRENFDKH